MRPILGSASGAVRRIRVRSGTMPRMSRVHDPAHRFSSAEFRSALGMFATGVTIVTALDAAGKPVGVTANSFNSVSLDPPLVLWSLATRSASMPVFRTNSHYVVNVLASSQLDLCKRFATVKGDRFEVVSHAAAEAALVEARRRVRLNERQGE